MNVPLYPRPRASRNLIMKCPPSILKLSIALVTVFGNPTLTPAGELFPPVGPPQPTMKRLDEINPSRCISSLPYTISEPGKYELCGNLNGESNSHGITISSSNVSLNLSGFTITGTDGSLDGIHISDGADNVSITNGSIVGWSGNGIDASSDSNQRTFVSDVLVSSCAGDGLVLSNGSVENSYFLSNSGNGLSIKCPDGSCRTDSVRLHGVTTSDNRSSGISCVNPPPLIMDSCISSKNDRFGVSISMSGSGGRAQDYNSSRSNNINVIGNGGGGFEIRTSSGVDATFSLTNFESSGNQGPGVRAVCGTTDNVQVNLSRCVTNKNAGEGLRFENALITLSEVSSNKNKSHGLYLSTSSANLRAQDYNSSRSNNSSACYFGDNGGNGVFVRVEPPAVDPGTDPIDVEEVSFISCSMTENASDGIGLEGNVSLKLDRCDVSGNSQVGLRITSTSYSSGLSKADAKRCLFNSNNGGGIFCPSANGTVDISLSDSEISRCGRDSLIVSAGPSATEMRLHVDRCVINGSTGSGITFDSTFSGGDPAPSSLLVRDSSIERCTGDGIYTVAEDVEISSSSVRHNGGSGVVCECNHLISVGSGFSSNGKLGLDIVSSFSDIRDTSCVSNRSGGAVVDSNTFLVSSSSFVSNQGQGLHCPKGGGSVKSCVVSSNLTGGIRIDGSGVDVSSNVVSGHRNASNDSAGISVHGTGNRIHGNMTSSNDNGVALYANGNPVYESSSTGENPLYEDAGVSNNSSGTNTIDAAPNSLSIITH